MEMSNRQSVPDSKRPIMMIRLRLGHEEPEIWRKTFEQLKKNRECCDEVWFSTGVGIPVLEEHHRLSDLIAAHAEDLRRIGIIPSLQIQATIGHSDSITESAGAEGKTWSGYVGVHGEQCKYINCPRQPGFLEYLKEMSRIYAEWKPGSVWIDDDLRLYNHRPAADGYGCYCPYCLSLFNRQEENEYTRESLIAAYNLDPKLKQRWYDFGKQSLCGIAETIVRKFHEISPDTRFGFQHNGDTVRIQVFDTLQKNSGSRPGSRPGGGAYSDHDPYQILDKAFYTSMQMADQPGYETLGQICPEIESCPRDFCCKTSQGLRIESLLALAMGTDSLSYFVMDPVYETPEWYGEELLKPLAAESSCYRDFIRHNQGAMPGGLGLPRKALIPVETQGLPLVGVPAAAYSPYAGCWQVTRNVVDKLSDEELTELFHKNILLDGTAAMAIQERKLQKLLGGIKITPIGENVFDFYTNNPFNSGLTAAKHYPFSDNRYVFQSSTEGKTVVLSHYMNRQKQDFGIGTMLWERPDGTRIAFIGDDGYNTKYIASSRVRFLNRIVDWVSHGSLPVMTLDPVQCLLVPRITAQGILRSVTILNTTISWQKPFTLELRNLPEGTCHIEWIVPSEVSIPLEMKNVEGRARIVLPRIAPWGVGWIKIL